MIAPPRTTGILSAACLRSQKSSLRSTAISGDVVGLEKVIGALTDTPPQKEAHDRAPVFPLPCVTVADKFVVAVPSIRAHHRTRLNRRTQKRCQTGAGYVRDSLDPLPAKSPRRIGDS